MGGPRPGPTGPRPKNGTDKVSSVNRTSSVMAEIEMDPMAHTQCLIFHCIYNKIKEGQGTRLQCLIV